MVDDEERESLDSGSATVVVGIAEGSNPEAAMAAAAAAAAAAAWFWAAMTSRDGALDGRIVRSQTDVSCEGARSVGSGVGDEDVGDGIEEGLDLSARRLVLMRDQGWSGGLTITSSGIWSGQVGGLGLLKGKGTGQVAVVVGCGGGLDDRKPGPQGERSGPIRCPGHTQRMVVIRELWDGWMDGWMKRKKTQL